MLSSANKPDPSSLHGRAEADLRFIRQTIEGAAAFSSVSGLGLALAGGVGLATVWLNLTQSNVPLLTLWLPALVLAGGLSTSLTLLKARRQGASLWSASGRRLLFAFCPSMLVGGVITFALAAEGRQADLPSYWLSLYGSALMTAGAHSLRPLSLLGAAFLLLGIVNFLRPDLDWPLLALGFGGLHLLGGAWLWRHHGG